MFLFGHVGLTWGGVLLLVGASRRLREPGRRRPPSAPEGRQPAGRRPAGAWIDYRFLLLGSMLPDLIDKPLGVFIFRRELSNGRIFAHGLLFEAVILLAARAWKRRAGRALGSLALGMAAHLVLDRMWRDPRALFWPLGGWRPKRQDVSGWLEQMLEELFTSPYTYLSEAAGTGVSVTILASLLRGGGLGELLRSGKMGPSFGRRPEQGLAAGEEGTHELERGERPAQR